MVIKKGFTYAVCVTVLLGGLVRASESEEAFRFSRVVAFRQAEKRGRGDLMATVLRQCSADDFQSKIWDRHGRGLLFAEYIATHHPVLVPVMKANPHYVSLDDPGKDLTLGSVIQGREMVGSTKHSSVQEDRESNKKHWPNNNVMSETIYLPGKKIQSKSNDREE